MTNHLDSIIDKIKKLEVNKPKFRILPRNKDKKKAKIMEIIVNHHMQDPRIDNLLLDGQEIVTKVGSFKIKYGDQYTRLLLEVLKEVS